MAWVQVIDNRGGMSASQPVSAVLRAPCVCLSRHNLRRAVSSGRRRSTWARLLADGCDDVSFRCRRFGDEGAQRLRGILQQAGADGPFAVYEAPDGTFIYAEAPRGRGCTAEYLDAVGKVFRKILL